MDKATLDAILEACKPKSNQLNAVDLEPGPITVDILNVREVNREIWVDLSGDWKPWHPCKGMIRIMLKVFGPNWQGQRLTLFREPSVLFSGVRVGGIEISHMTGIKEPTTFDVVVTRGKNKQVTIHPLPPVGPTADDTRDIEQITEDIDAAESLETLKAVGFVLKNKPKAVQDGCRKAYAKRQKELKADLTGELFDKGPATE